MCERFTLFVLTVSRSSAINQVFESAPLIAYDKYAPNVPRVQPNCRVKGETAALSVRAQCCQSHYFSSTPRTPKNAVSALHNTF